MIRTLSLSAAAAVLAAALLWAQEAGPAGDASEPRTEAAPGEAAAPLDPAAEGGDPAAPAPLGEIPSEPEPDFTAKDLRRELVLIGQLIEDFRNQLRPSGATLPSEAGLTRVDALTRLNALEQRLAEVTGALETLRFDIDRMAEDGGRRMSDMDFRLTLLESGDPSFVPPPQPLGGGVTPPEADSSPFPDSEIALSEQFAYDSAVASLDGGRLDDAVAQFDSFLSVYGDGPLAQDARFGRIDALLALGQPDAAAEASLEIFEADPAGGDAARALLHLGRSLGQLGLRSEACLTFGEAAARVSPDAPQALRADIEAERLRFSCG